MLSGARTCARVTDLNLEFQFVMLPADFTAATAAVAAGVAVPAAAAAIVTVNPSAAAVPPQPFCCSFVLSISTCSTICLLLSLIFIFLSHSLAKAPSALQPSVFIHQIYIYIPYTHMCVCVGMQMQHARVVPVLSVSLFHLHRVCFDLAAYKRLRQRT